MKLYKTDYIVIIALLFNGLARLLTNAITSTISVYTQAANLLETNPAMRLTLNLSYWQFLLYAAQAAIIVLMYIYARKKYGEKSWIVFGLALFLLIFVLYDFTNDLGIWIGLLIHK